MVLAAAMLGIYLSRGVWTRYQEERRSAQQAETQMQLAEAKKSELLKQKAELESESGREKLAREHGWTRPGEKPL